VGLGHKGRIAAGAAADLVAFAPDQGFTVEADRLEHRNPVTPYAGRQLTGVVRRTWLRGAPIDSDGSRGSGEVRGRLLIRQS
jgi:allantoinase